MTSCNVPVVSFKESFGSNSGPEQGPSNSSRENPFNVNICTPWVSEWVSKWVFEWVVSVLFSECLIQCVFEWVVQIVSLVYIFWYRSCRTLTIKFFENIVIYITPLNEYILTSKRNASSKTLHNLLHEHHTCAKVLSIVIFVCGSLNNTLKIWVSLQNLSKLEWAHHFKGCTVR